MQLSLLFFTVRIKFLPAVADRIGEGFGGFVVEATFCIVNLSLSRVSLAGEPLESTIECAGNFLFRSYRRLRGRGHNHILPSLSKRWATLGRAGHSRGWRCHHDDRGGFIFPGTSLVATAHRNCFSNNRSAALAPVSERTRLGILFDAEVAMQM
jgi:hypothetical protein